MPKLSLDVPDDLYDAVRSADIAVSEIVQEALTEAVSRRRNAEWIDRARSRPVRHDLAIDTSALLADTRAELQD